MKRLILLFAFFFSFQTVAEDWFTATVTNGAAPLSTIMKWKCPEGSTTAVAGSSRSSVWTGTRPISGTQYMSGIGSNIEYTLECRGPAPSTTPIVTLTWSYDGPAPEGVRLYWSKDQATLGSNTPTTVPGTTTVADISNLELGPTYFLAEAFNGTQKKQSNVLSVDVQPSVQKVFKAAIDIVIEKPVPNITLKSAVQR